MKRALAVAATAAVVAAETCNFQRHGELCPTTGAACNGDMLCLAGSCIADRWGETSWSGYCRDDGPYFESVYSKECAPDKLTDCVFYNPLALSPRSGPSYLQCARATGDSKGTCRLEPNNHGDACNIDGECASRKCLRETRICKGIEEGLQCTPGLYPDQCADKHYCAPDASSQTGGKCQKTVSPGRTCSYANACERGTYCAGSSLDGTKNCVAPFTVVDGATTTIGPYMCKSGNAIMVQQGANSVDSVYQCLSSNSTLTGQPCDSGNNATIPRGYECRCSSDGTMRLRTVAALGLGARSVVWNNLFQCMLASTNIMGLPCEFDQLDMERVRYGSCVYYACYPYYLQLVNVTGGRTFTDPLRQFEADAACEAASVKKYYENVFSTPCLAIPNMENWKCTSLLPPTSLSIASTTAVICFVFVAVIFGYWGHMWYHRKVYSKLGVHAGELGTA